jgi:hypothetical protein
MLYMSQIFIYGAEVYKTVQNYSVNSIELTYIIIDSVLCFKT